MQTRRLHMSEIHALFLGQIHLGVAVIMLAMLWVVRLAYHRSTRAERSLVALVKDPTPPPMARSGLTSAQPLQMAEKLEVGSSDKKDRGECASSALSYPEAVALNDNSLECPTATPLVQQPRSGLRADHFASTAAEQIAHVLATSEFVLSERRSAPAPRLAPSPAGSPMAEFAQRFCTWLLAGGANGMEFAREDIYRLACHYARLTGSSLPQLDDALFEAMAEVRGVDKKQHRPCRVRGLPQTATTTYTLYGENEVRLIEGTLRANRRVRAGAVTQRTGRV
jgi:hypothetical protein